MADALLLNGTVGAGKTTTARALGTRLARTGVPHAVIDLDSLRLLDPPPHDDPFQLGDVLVVGSEGPDEIAERAARTAGW